MFYLSLASHRTRSMASFMLTMQIWSLIYARTQITLKPKIHWVLIYPKSIQPLIKTISSNFPRMLLNPSNNKYQKIIYIQTTKILLTNTNQYLRISETLEEKLTVPWENKLRQLSWILSSLLEKTELLINEFNNLEILF